MVRQALTPDQIEKLRGAIQERAQRWQRGSGTAPGATGDRNAWRRPNRPQRGTESGGGDSGGQCDKGAKGPKGADAGGEKL